MPDGADIFLGEGKRPIGATPVTLPIDLTGVASVKLTLKKAGYDDYEQIVVDDTPLSINLTVVGAPPPGARGNAARAPDPAGGRQGEAGERFGQIVAGRARPSLVAVVGRADRRNHRIVAPRRRRGEPTGCEIVRVTMFRGRVVAVVIPACNEADKIAATIRSVPGFVDHVIVVDDGSRDATAAIARRAAGTRERGGRRPHRGHRPRRATAAWARRSRPGTRARSRSAPTRPP